MNQPDEVYLNLVLEFIPETSYQVLRSYIRAKRHFPLLFTKAREAPWNGGDGGRGGGGGNTVPLCSGPLDALHGQVLQVWTHTHTPCWRGRTCVA
jgi:hypothetical protein